jgi:hypothetical protein
MSSLVEASVAEHITHVAVGLNVEVGDLGGIPSRSDAVLARGTDVAGDADLVGGIAHLDDGGN